MVRGVSQTLGAMGSDYQTRLAEAMRLAGETTTTLAKKLGVSYQAIKKVEAGTSKMLSADNHMRACQLMGIDPLWLATGEGSPRASGPWPLSPDLLDTLSKAGSTAIRRAENAARAALDMEPLPKQETALAA